MQPLIMNFTGKKVVIAGAGRIAARKARVLSEEKAEITFIAPEVSKETEELSEAWGYTIIRKKAEKSDFDGAILVILATNDRLVNETLSRELPPNQLVCVVDGQGEGNVIFPATVRRGMLQIAVTSSGASPKLTRKLKKQLENQFDHSWEPYAAFLAECRSLIKKLKLVETRKHELLWNILDDEYRSSPELQREMLLKLHELQPGGLD
ncbi:bifunctional precorrin-2 dehydrogenase/sirohydrochlorin ferrochelatase [Peribacillus sp. SCS-26]|uniref:precorrin-2 dehydrogenase/sirohydrochlorin ferrochelatase family protein n=1 Tax=Paraperibacillus marinus TaxID=3115295 RepID=UPI00390621D0